MSTIAILHLEDSDLDAELVHARLAKGGLVFTIDRAASRDEFLAALGAREHDLILADYSLPDFDGLSALEIARRAAPETPFIFVSGMLGEEVAIDTLKRGATDYVLKQRLERLAPAVHRALAESRERAERRKAEAALREGEVRHRLVLDSIKDYAIVTTDTGGLVTGWTGGAAQVFGYDEAEVVGRPIDALFTPEDVEAGVPQREMVRTLRGARADDERWHVRRDGSRFWGGGVLVPLRDEAGALRGFTKVLRDMTERKRAEDALREADRRKDEFLAMLAHELRNPLSAIHNAVQLAMRPGLPPDRVEWTREVIAHQVRHLARLVDDLLDVSRITRGKIQLRKQPVALDEVARRAAETMRGEFEGRGHELAVEIGPGPLVADADPTRLEQVLVNLLTNAAKYTEAGGHVALSAGREGGEVVVRVRDDGVGMTPEMLSRVFDLFAQADDSLDRSKGGLGIGLTVAKGLVEMHGGKLSASSDGQGRGSEFTVRLPSADVAAPAGAGGEPDAAGAPEPAGARVLVVDDNEPTACSLAEMLRFSGHAVDLAHDGGEAIDAARRFRPDVILLDIGLPTLDGYQVARKLRHEDGFGDALIIAITGYGGDQAVSRSVDAGFDHHMVKPVDYDRLCELLAGGRPRDGHGD